MKNQDNLKDGVRKLELLKKYSQNRNVEGFELVEQLMNDEILLGVVDEKQGLKGETLGMRYEIVSVDYDKKLFSTRVTMDENYTSKLIINKLQNKEIDEKYVDWIKSFSTMFGEFILDVFDDFSIQTMNYVRIGSGIINSEFLEPKNKTGFRLFPQNY
jgi:hypothetical protein